MQQTGPSAKPRILVAPLDWGLGHATRCIPIIRALLKRDCIVILAGDGNVKTLLHPEFPQLLFLHLPGYNIQYSKDKWIMPFSVIGQIPKIISAIETEKKWLEETVEEYRLDAVISDNRYGLYHNEIPCVFITHQLLIKTGFGNIPDEILQIENYRYINRFAECWVPDAAGDNSLAGDLSHPENLPEVPVHYLGALSRFAFKETPDEKKHLMIILSGPEPQRTILEELLLLQLKEYTQPVVFLRGMPGNDASLEVAPHVIVHNHLSAAELERLICEASFVVSRCGYSTVMDLAALKKKSILIPTPGQTEQEYLAKHLMKQNFALCIAQDKFRLKNAFELATSFNYQFADFIHSEKVESAIDNFLVEFNE